MGASKFLRKRSKMILIVGGALLMVAWLLPQTLQQFGRNPGNSQYMRIDGHKVSGAQASEAERRLFAARQIMGGVSLEQLGIKSLAHWMLLVHEAKLHGLIGGPADGREFLELGMERHIQQQIQMAAFTGQTPPPIDQLRAETRAAMETGRARVAAEARLTPDQVDLGLAEFRGVDRLRRLASNNAARISDRRTIPEALEQHNQATIDYVFIPADNVLDQVAVPDDAALAAQLDRFRDVRPSEGEYGIGYTLPPRIKLEWLALDREAIASAIRVGRVEVMERYQKDNPTAEGAIPPEKRAEIESALRKEAADRVVAEAEKAIRAEFARSLRKLEKTGDRYNLPADWDAQRPDLNKVRDAVVEAARRAGAEIPAPTVVVRNADWLSSEDLTALPGIGRSFMQRGTQRVPFSMAALSVTEAGGTGDWGVQVGVPGAVTRDFAENLYFWTVLDARPESPATSVDEIRDRLAKDKRRLDAYELLVRDAEVYRQRAINEGLDALTQPPAQGAAAGAALPEIRRGATVSRSNPAYDQPRLQNEKVRDAIMKAAERLDPTQDIAALPADGRTITVPIPGQLGLAVVQITAFRPLTSELYRQRDNMTVSMMAQELSTPEDDPFSLERLTARHNAELPPQREDDQS